MHTIGKSIAIFILAQGQGIEQTHHHRCLDRQVCAPVASALESTSPEGLEA